MDIVTVRFPLDGEWVAVNTPDEKIPSHGTDLWGQTYAYDFLRILWNEKGYKFFVPANHKYWLRGITLNECPGYGEQIYAPFSGVVMETYDGFPERQYMHPLVDYLRVVKNSLLFEQDNEKGNKELVPMLGNYIIIKQAESDVYALFAHLRPEFVLVKKNEEITIGQQLAQVGHTGNSTAPHLHFQLMDRIDLKTAKGIPCSFDGYERFEDGSWQAMGDSMPGKRQLIRGVAPNQAHQPMPKSGVAEL